MSPGVGEGDGAFPSSPWDDALLSAVSPDRERLVVPFSVKRPILH